MIYSKSTEYAIRVLIYLSLNSSKTERIGVQKAATDLGFPRHYLGKILQTLAKNHFITSAKGPNGGFYATDKTLSLNLLSVIHLFNGLEFLDTCGLGLTECDEMKPCPIHSQYQVIKDNLYQILSEKTIRQVKDDLENGNAFMDIKMKNGSLRKESSGS